MSEQTNEVVNLLRGFARKLASAPERMTTTDGQEGITTSKAQAQKDSGEGDLKQDLPVDGTVRISDSIGEGATSATTADGCGGVTTAPGSTAKYSGGEGDIKQDIAPDGMPRKSARVEAIRNALLGKNPELAPTKSAAPTSAPEVAVEPAKQAAGEPKIELSNDLLAKIASQILSTEEGINFVYGMQEKAAGAQAARQELETALQAAEYYDQVEHVKSAALNDVFSKAAAIHDELSQLITEEEADEILKTAALHQAAILGFEDEILKSAYVAGMDDAALMEAAGEAGEGEAGEEEVGELPMSGEEGLGEEEVLQILAELIESGELTEEEVMQAISEAEGQNEGEAEAAPNADAAAADGAAA